MGALIGFTILVITFTLYFIPSWIALHKRKKNTGAILALNILTGWTFIGWIVAFVWAMMNDDTK